jgi:PAS domain S-box-containing protein
MLKFIFIDDNEEDYISTHKKLIDHGLKFTAVRIETEIALIQSLQETTPDTVIISNPANGLNLDLSVKIIRKFNKRLPYIVLSDDLREKKVVELLKGGATDCLSKNERHKLPFAVERALQWSTDQSRLKTLVNNYEEIENNYRILADSGQALIWTSGTDMKCDWFNATWLHFTGRTMEEEIGDGWTEHVHPEDLEFCVNKYVNAFKNREHFSMLYRLKRHDGEYRWIQDNGSPRNNLAGDFKGYIGYCLDITETVIANLSLKKALAEKQILMRELYHRTNNNLQTILSILNMQSLHMKDPAIQSLFTDTENRIVTMALMHQQLYHKDDLSSIDINKYIKELSDRLFLNFREISDRILLRIPTPTFITHIDVALPMGMLYNELLTNSLKHAFPGGRKGNIIVRIEKTAQNQIRFDYSDDGVGVPADFDFRNQNSTGFSYIFGISESQLGSTVEVRNQNGLKWNFLFSDNLNIRRV